MKKLVMLAALFAVASLSLGAQVGGDEKSKTETVYVVDNIIGIGG